MRAALILAAAVLLLGGLVVTAPAAPTGKAFLWNGKNWQQVSQDGKAGYIFGMGNLADFEVASSRGSKASCISGAFVQDLKTTTVMQIIQAVDKFYQDNPKKLDTPVIEVILRQYTNICPPESPKGGIKR
jgi:hypothetical protein